MRQLPKSERSPSTPIGRRAGLAVVLVALHGICTGAQSAEAEIIGCQNDSECSDGAACEKVPGTPDLLRITQCVLRNRNGISAFFDQEGTIKANEFFPGGQWNRLERIELKGTITKPKVAYVRQILANHKPTAGFYMGARPEKYDVSIDSPGGDVYAAMALGRIFRENLVMIKLNDDAAQCASACIFAWAGAPMRRVTQDQPSFVIHRPFGFASAAQDLPTASSGWKMLQSDIRQYFLEMNIPTALVDAMNEVPSESGRELSPDELSRYLITADDPAVTETTEAKESQKLGISRTEYLARKRRFNECEVDPNADNEFCMKERCNVTTDASTISFCNEFVSSPQVKANLEKLRRQNN